MSVERTRMLFTTERFERMVEAGVLGPDDRVELIEGEIVEMSPIGTSRAACVKRLIRLLTRSLDDRAIVGVQDPLRLPPRSAPQPDLAVLRPRDDFYESAHPGAGDTLLAIEVADTSVRFDRLVKVPMYARAGVSEVWLVDIPSARVEVYRGPAEGAYTSIEVLESDGVLSLAAFPDVAFAVADILASRPA
jgi:Uma2 family endonuclease